MAMGVAELKAELADGIGLLEVPEIHQFLDGFYLSRIGIRILIGQQIALHEPQREDYVGACMCRAVLPCWGWGYAALLALRCVHSPAF